MENYHRTNIDKGRVKVYSKRQVTILSNALFVPGVGFIFTALIGFLSAWLLREKKLTSKEFHNEESIKFCLLGIFSSLPNFINSSPVYWRYKILNQRCQHL